MGAMTEMQLRIEQLELENTRLKYGPEQPRPDCGKPFVWLVNRLSSLGLEKEAHAANFLIDMADSYMDSAKYLQFKRADLEAENASLNAEMERLSLENARLRADKQPALNVWEQCLMDATSNVIEANQNCSGAEPSVSVLAEAADNLIGVILDADLPYDHPIWEKWRGVSAAKQANELAALRAKLESLPADWTTDSSLKTWFPFTADTLDKLEGENRSLRTEVEQLRAYKAECEGQEPVAEVEDDRDGDTFIWPLPNAPVLDDGTKLYAHPIPSNRVASAQHTDDIAVDRFAELMKQKLAKARDKGRGGWDNPMLCKVEDLARMLVDHIPKGDPIDVANFAMMLCLREGGYEALKSVTAKPADRITEDDAMEIAVNYAAYAATRLAAKTLPITFNDWLDEGGRQLLDKLNGVE